MCMLGRQKNPRAAYWRSLEKMRQMDFSEKCSINLWYPIMVMMGASFILAEYKLCLTAQCKALCPKGDSPSTETLQALLGSAGGCPELLEEGPAQTIFLREQPHTSDLYQKPPLPGHIQSLCSPLWAPPWATCPKTLCWELQDCQSSRRFCYKFCCSSKSRTFRFKFLLQWTNILLSFLCSG